MLTLDNLLSENPVSSSDEDALRHAINCSPFLARLFTNNSNLMNDLLENHHQAYQLSEMQNFLSQQNIFDEVTTVTKSSKLNLK